MSLPGKRSLTWLKGELNERFHIAVTAPYCLTIPCYRRCISEPTVQYNKCDRDVYPISRDVDPEGLLSGGHLYRDGQVAFNHLSQAITAVTDWVGLVTHVHIDGESSSPLHLPISCSGPHSVSCDVSSTVEFDIRELQDYIVRGRHPLGHIGQVTAIHKSFQTLSYISQGVNDIC